jgi:predicted Ser/Thr protein kinase
MRGLKDKASTINELNKLSLQQFLGGRQHFVPKRNNKPKSKPEPKLKIKSSLIHLKKFEFDLEKHFANFIINPKRRFEQELNQAMAYAEAIKTIKEQLHFEDIQFVNEIITEDIQYIFEQFIKNKCQDLVELGKGGFSRVYEYKDYAIKIFRDGVYGECNKDPEILKKICHLDLYPKLYAYYPRKFMITEKIHGYTLNKYRDLNTSKKLEFIKHLNITELLKEVQIGIKQTNNLKIYINDDHTENIMVTHDKKIKIIDVGHFKEVTHSFPNTISRLNHKILELFNIDFV